jgi:predicted HTH domain antitoxin
MTMGIRSLEIEYPDEVLVGIDEEQLKALAREALFVKLYERGLISSGHAGELLGMTRWDFLDLLGRYGVSYFDENIDFDEELRRARP